MVPRLGPPMPFLDVAVLAKRFDRAKSRLEFFPSSQRSRLAEAMLLDTLTAVLPVAHRVVVVSGEPQLAPRLAKVLPTSVLHILDDPGELNSAVAAADVWFHTTPPRSATPPPWSATPTPTVRIALVADLPAITATDLAAAARGAASHPRSFVVDASGVGTTAVCATNARLVSYFGSSSAARHRRAGLAVLSEVGAGIRHDVDTIDDLRRAAALGLGSHTATVLSDTGVDVTAWT